MAVRLCLAIAWLALCALGGPATPVAEGPEPPAAVPDAISAPEPEPPLKEPPVAAPPTEATPPLVPELPEGSDAPASAPPRGTPPPPPADPTSSTRPRAAERPGEDPPTAFPAASGAVTIRDFSFGPAAITVGVGDTVTWRNAGPSEHSATAADGSFDTGLLAEGESSSKEFASAGTFSYICTPHPFMKGTVRVVAQSSGDGLQDGVQTGSPVGGGEGAAVPAGSALPRTGRDVSWMLIAGVGLLAIGIAGRRKVRDTVA